jgi:hypothetical protein
VQGGDPCLRLLGRRGQVRAAFCKQEYKRSVVVNYEVASGFVQPR